MCRMFCYLSYLKLVVKDKLYSGLDGFRHTYMEFLDRGETIWYGTDRLDTYVR